MIGKLWAVLLAVVTGAQPLFAQIPAETRPDMDPAGFEKALKNAATDPAVPFGFSVHCRDDDGNRSARLYQGGVAVWGGTLQIGVGRELRLVLLNDLISAGFSSFALRYGGRNGDERSKAPLRVSCRINVVVDGLEKESVQLADGEQSPALTGLASSLLDRLEPLAAGGVGADSLEDGLRKIAAGTLTPETLSIRLVQLPDEGSDRDGDIVRVDSARWSWRHYRPGKAGPAVDWNPLPADFAAEFADAAVVSKFWSIPVNVPGTGHGEIEVQVLNHHKTVISRAFTRIEPGSMTAEKDRFDAVVAAVRQLRQ